jgi:GTPase SAR1 family protein
MKSPQPLNTNPTLGVDFSNLKVNIGDKILCLRIFDTAGTEVFYNIIKNFFPQAKGFIFVYDVNSR